LRDYGYSRPPIPVEQIAVAEGLTIVRVMEWDERMSGYFEHATKTIGVNGKHHRHRQRFTIAHELGHFFLAHPQGQCYDQEISLEEQKREFDTEANEFASELLIPYALIKEDLRKVRDPKALAQLYEVSEQALWVYLLKRRLIRG
jgi:Zn-dependent peptidase ImmA (M78 family)